MARGRASVAPWRTASAGRSSREPPGSARRDDEPKPRLRDRLKRKFGLERNAAENVRRAKHENGRIESYESE